MGYVFLVLFVVFIGVAFYFLDKKSEKEYQEKRKELDHYANACGVPSECYVNVRSNETALMIINYTYDLISKGYMIPTEKYNNLVKK